MSAEMPARTGSYVGTGAIKEIRTVGARPRAIKFINVSTGAVAEWQDTMDDDTVVTHDSGVDSAGAVAGGVTPLVDGFSVGVNAVINTVGNEVHYTAFF